MSEDEAQDDDEFNEAETEYWRRYQAAAHAMQSGVAGCIQAGIGADNTSKHLRVGINTMQSDQGALVALLISTGVFTREEYLKQIAEFMEREKQSYEKKLTDHLGGETKFTLG